MNLLDQLTSIASLIDTRFSIVPTYRASAKGDVRIVCYPSDSECAAKARAMQEALQLEPHVARITRRAGSLLVSFTDDQIAKLGAALESSNLDAIGTSDLMTGHDVVVNFCDANPTKALHVGHLRNLALGNALAATLEAAGANVIRQSQVSDYCRSMGEALAGHLERPDETPDLLSVKSDHFVGECYTRYARMIDDAAGGSDPVLQQEGAPRGDIADQLLARWADGDTEVVGPWECLREWALAGQRTTLSKLGIELDHFLYESDCIDVARWILAAGLDKGVLTRTEAGDVVYETDDEHYPQLLLARSDGFPTQHLRSMAIWQMAGPALDGVCSIEIVGDEWRSYVRNGRRIMELIAPQGDERHPTHNLMYGMVRTHGHTVKSRDGAPPLVDDMLEQLSTSDQVRCLADESGGRIDAGQIARIVALGRYLGCPKHEPVELARPNEHEGLEWTLARALVDAWQERNDGPPDPAPEDTHYRYIVLQSQIHRRLIANSLQHNDLEDLARFHGHLSQQYLAMAPSHRRARLMRATLGAGLRALGLARPAL
jgi:arginyl-tRNA synthetase